MDGLAKVVSEKIGISEDMVKQTVEVMIGFLNRLRDGLLPASAQESARTAHASDWVPLDPAGSSRSKQNNRAIGGFCSPEIGKLCELADEMAGPGRPRQGVESEE
ncbi:MAG: hypothetical protein PVF77_18210 [Anaerolineae bacterium]|jgi:hypothetical protein